MDLPAPDPANGASSIFLIGMMGSGKSTVGRHLARACGLGFVDSDRELERRSGVTLATIFEVEGEDGFRSREARLLAELVQRPRIVLATGGGAVLRAESRRLLRQHGLVVYLDTPADELARRVAHETNRPLLQVADPRARLQQLLEQREPLYREAAHVVVRSGLANPGKMVHWLLGHPAVAAVVAKP